MVLSFFQWLESLKFGAVIDDSGYFIATINVAHLLSLAIFVGAVLIVDLRLLGSGLSKQPVSRVARGAQPWLIAGFLALAVTGVLQIMATPMKVYYSSQFWLKMGLVVVAVIFTFTLRRQVAQWDDARLGMWGRVVAVASLLLWTTIAVEGRLIGLLQ
jgi:hypothetical protein